MKDVLQVPKHYLGTMQYNNKITNTVPFNSKPSRIVSLVPSKTELLFHLGLEEEVLGITKFCIHPRLWFESKNRIGGTKNINIQKILNLQPDLIIANKEENDKAQIESLQNKIPVWLSDIQNFEDALDMIANLGSLLKVEKMAYEIIYKIKQSKTEHSINNTTKLSAAYMIWDKPMMVAGGDTYINDMMKLAGFNNVFAHQNRYPSVSKEDLQTQNPEILLLSSEPFPFKQKHLKKYENILPKAKIVLADGTMFSWYGSRLIEAFPYFSMLRLDN